LHRRSSAQYAHTSTKAAVSGRRYATRDMPGTMRHVFGAKSGSISAGSCGTPRAPSGNMSLRLTATLVVVAACGGTREAPAPEPHEGAVSTDGDAAKEAGPQCEAHACRTCAPRWETARSTRTAGPAAIARPAASARPSARALRMSPATDPTGPGCPTPGCRSLLPARGAGRVSMAAHGPRSRAPAASLTPAVRASTATRHVTSAWTTRTAGARARAITRLSTSAGSASRRIARSSIRFPVGRQATSTQVLAFGPLMFQAS
jgi:hypothetical protein